MYHFRLAEPNLAPPAMQVARVEHARSLHAGRELRCARRLGDLAEEAWAFVPKEEAVNPDATKLREQRCLRSAWRSLGSMKRGGSMASSSRWERNGFRRVCCAPVRAPRSSTLKRGATSADSLKTGYYAAAGFEVTATATRDGLHLLAVVLGAPTKRGCFDEASRLLSAGFAGYRTVQAAKAGQPAGGTITVASGTLASFAGVATRDLRFTLPRAEAAEVKVQVKVPPQIAAPVKKGQVVGEILVVRGDKQLGRVEVVAPAGVDSTS